MDRKAQINTTLTDLMQRTLSEQHRIIPGPQTTDLSPVLSKLADIETAIDTTQAAITPQVVQPEYVIDMSAYAEQYNNISTILTELVGVVGKLAGVGDEDTEALKESLKETTETLAAEYQKTAELTTQLTEANRQLDEMKQKASSFRAILSQIDQMTDEAVG
jgi:chromosome segregation ATPase